MPVALKSMLCLLNDAKSYASTEDNSLPTYIEVRFDKRNVFNHGSCIRIQYNAIQYNTSLLRNALSIRCGVTWNDTPGSLQVFHIGELSACEKKSRNIEKNLASETGHKVFSSPAKLLRKTEKAYSGSVVVINTLIAGWPKLLVYGLFRK